MKKKLPLKKTCMKFRIIFRFTDDGIAARSADFPELTATGCTIAEVEGEMEDTIREHIEYLQAQSKWNDLFEPTSPVAGKRRL